VSSTVGLDANDNVRAEFSYGTGDPKKPGGWIRSSVGPAQFNYSIRPDGSWQIDQNDFVSSAVAARAIELLDDDLEASMSGSTAAGGLKTSSLHPLSPLVSPAPQGLVDDCRQRPLVNVQLPVPETSPSTGVVGHPPSCDDVNHYAQWANDQMTKYGNGGNCMWCKCSDTSGFLQPEPDQTRCNKQAPGCYFISIPECFQPLQHACSLVYDNCCDRCTTDTACHRSSPGGQPICTRSTSSNLRLD
jgi:hypothetical protein